MSSELATLTSRHADATQRLILETAVEVLESAGVGELTVRAVARRAGMSERTVFRYFATRDEFLTAVAGEVARTIHAPPPPERLAELPAYPAALYARFEERPELVQGGLHSELFDRIRGEVAVRRWDAVAAVIEREAAHRPEAERRRASVNIAYYLTASTWRYHRFYFGLSAAETVACAERAVRLVVEDLGR